MKNIVILVSFFVSAPVVYGNETKSDMKLVWSDDFDADALDTSAWQIVEGDGCPELCGFGNHELQIYSRYNLKLENGVLILEARKEESITSAKLTTQAMPGWKYGKISVRARLPKGVGTWPAIWMLPDNNSYGGWPSSGEIDIMEHVGYNPNHIHGTIHTAAFNHKIGTQQGGEIVLPTASERFHTYTIEWTAQDIRWLIDDQDYFVFQKPESSTIAQWPFDEPFHLILNLAIGGDWAGRMGVDEALFPARFEIDWVKVWQ